MTALNKISLSELAGKGKGVGVTKAGKSEAPSTNKKPYVDPFTLDEVFPVTITGQSIKISKLNGCPQLEITTQVTGTEEGGKFWLDLPAVGEDSDLNGANEMAYVTRAAKNLLKFLRALAPEEFNIFASIDKSDPTSWKYLNSKGKVMSMEVREARAAQVDNAIIGFTNSLLDGHVSLVGMELRVQKRPNPHSAKYPYINWFAKE